ncbi:hypothetical protein M404DRAFT_21781 [Pisolithus tinctorius Marx 270]|uniref:Uncharacterized protein n=1 Tax=Pisolithus tinctorius Marx 270 TaxID=870435 RepID=A0A0C3PMQ4_PISTI|nr:hypothetical protein M404DRAFT_21781 [Pisolithus tinctorius Marx 270]
MSDLRPTMMTDNISEGQIIVNWTQVLDDAIKYDTDNKEEMMKVKRTEWEAKERRVHEEEEKHKAKAGAGGSEAGEVKKEVMDPGLSVSFSWMAIRSVLPACDAINQKALKCQWPRDGKDAKASLKAIMKADKGKKQKANEENTEAGPSKKWVTASVKLIKVLDLCKDLV